LIDKWGFRCHSCKKRGLGDEEVKKQIAKKALMDPVTKVKVLNLSDIDIQCSGAKSSSQQLFLQDNNIGREGAVAIAKAL